MVPFLRFSPSKFSMHFSCYQVTEQLLPWLYRNVGSLQFKRDGTRGHTEGKWRGNWRMEWVASTLHTTSERGVSSITTADANTSASSSRLNWRPRWYKWTRTFRRKTKSGFCSCAFTFQLASTVRFFFPLSTFNKWSLPHLAFICREPATGSTA